MSTKNEVSDIHIPGVYWNRAVDTEAKTLEEIARNLGATKNSDGIITWGDTSATGTINLFTELPPCASCENVIKQFEKAYPNIKVNVFWKT